MKKSLREDKIDIVLLWVDGSDEEWLKKKKQYEPGLEISNEVNRFRDWGLLKYWFRGIEKNMSWINKIYFVVDNQKPSWLNEKHPKLKIVNHSDYIDEKYLPLFNSSAIECTINKIRGLSDIPGGYSFLDNKRVKIFGSRIGNSTKGNPGEIINVYDDGIGVRTNDSEIILTDIQVEGKTRELVKNYLNGIQDKNSLIGKKFD